MSKTRDTRNSRTTSSARGAGGTGRRASRPPRTPPRVVIERVEPVLDGGRHPVKRLEGDVLEVSANVFKDGHDLLAGRVLARPPGGRAWRRFDLAHDWDVDRWRAAVPLDRIGLWEFTLEAWPDAFGTWADGLAKKAEAGQDVASDLLEGAELVRAAAARARRGSRVARALAAAAGLLADRAATPDRRVAAAIDPELREAMAVHFDPALVTRHETTYRVRVDRARAGCAAWYEMFPRSQGAAPGEHGTFATAAAQLPRLADLGFDVVYLPPIHPIGHTKRKGPDNALVAGPDDPGSPWAIGSEEGGHDAVHPALGTLADFEAFVRRAEELGMEVALDFALQCSPDHPWAREHPEWFFLRPDGTIHYAENPPKKYEDIYPLNFWSDDRESLWAACRDLLLFWIERGVKTFRVDNPHTKPFAFWEWAIADVQRRHPDVVFLSEAFTRPNRMKGLAKLGFTQSYTYFTWRNTARELREYLTELAGTEMAEYFRPNFFTNTPDILNEFLQAGGRPAFRVRLLLAATLSPLYGIYGGFELAENVPREPGSEEYLHSEKYQLRWRDWDAPGSLDPDIRRLNRIRCEHPALRQLRNLVFHEVENENVLFYHKWADGPPRDDLLVVASCEPGGVQEAMVHVPLADLGLGPWEPYEVEDLLTGERWTWHGVRNYVRIDPAERAGHVFRVIRPGDGA
ncbi:MAG: alpha-1,4-glucan--maltose-1-phosphate maltosyltransferase [Gemmatimonadota bacterium]|nr:alpha-1,4-glucan--maltose-1-phosphate maltosyltransferase [Gemmatimonadota bacterium]